MFALVRRVFVLVHEFFSLMERRRKTSSVVCQILPRINSWTLLCVCLVVFRVFVRYDILYLVISRPCRLRRQWTGNIYNSQFNAFQIHQHRCILMRDSPSTPIEKIWNNILTENVTSCPGLITSGNDVLRQAMLVRKQNRRFLFGIYSSLAVYGRCRQQNLLSINLVRYFFTKCHNFCISLRNHILATHIVRDVSGEEKNFKIRQIIKQLDMLVVFFHRKELTEDTFQCFEVFQL